MNKIFKNKVLFIIGLLLLIALAGCQPGQQSASMSTAPNQSQNLQPVQPNIFFESTEHNFGQIPARSENQCFFEFSNIGDADLVIENIKSTCGCTVAQPSQTVIKPGQSSEISAVYKAGLSGTAQKRITLYTNDPDNPKVPLWIKASIISENTRQSRTGSDSKSRPQPRGNMPERLKQSLRNLNKSTGR